MTNSNSKVLQFALELAGDRKVQYVIDRNGTDSYDFWLIGAQSFEVTAGSERGVLYAVYDILNGKNKGSERPAFSIRGLNPCESLARHTPEQICRLLDRMGQWRMNTIIIHSGYGFNEHKQTIEEEAGKRGIELVHYTYYNLAFCENIPKQHFAKNALGHPKPDGDQLGCHDRLCASDPEGLLLYEQGVERYLRENPDYKHLLLATSDGYHYCECEACRRKDPIAQWEPFFNRFFDHSPDRMKEALIYVNRFRLPDDLTRIKRLDRIMFDTHLRIRRETLRKSTRPAHSRAINEDQVDARAIGTPINQYLLDRLKEWRAAYSGPLYVFENLMVQGLFGLPFPNASVYLDDIQTLHKEGVDGVIYEAFETGIRPFVPMFDLIAEALWNPQMAYEQTPFEKVFLTDMSGPEWPGNKYWEAHHDELPYPTVYRLTSKFKENPSWQTIGALMQELLARPDLNEFDWLYIGFTGMHLVHTQIEALAVVDPMEASFLNSHKLWDFMNKVERPRETTGRLIRQIVSRL